ncbi:energy-coupling factor transporter transmembrane component T [Clostridium sp.]|uniref:energy-coupling factor transporter transmembrane component T family protein n=1 Tax=Clostridium sp. TaxID=1506 RepID=UPI00262AA1CC|nr:energy-coupling factor transporter transmembrane component T [Clostridium sp.]
MNTMLTYIKKDSPIDRLTGATKLICFILWTLAAMLTYDTRVLLGMLIFSLIIFKVSKIEFKEVSFIIYFILFFLLLNDIAIFIFSPYQGVSIYGTRHNIFHIIGPYTLTIEQLFYEFNVTLKYLSVIPMALLFILATNPSEFAASLNKIGISYKIAYSVSIALRYIPDIQREYHDISFAQQARGIDMSKKEKLFKRIKNMSSILMPLIFSSLDRIENISTAMELRAFGKNKKRTWYSERKFTKGDYLSIIIVVIILGLSLWFNYKNGSRFYNPFI